MPVSFAVLECESEGRKSSRGAPDRRLNKELTWCRSGAPPPSCARAFLGGKISPHPAAENAARERRSLGGRG